MKCRFTNGSVCNMPKYMCCDWCASTECQYRCEVGHIGCDFYLKEKVDINEERKYPYDFNKTIDNPVHLKKCKYEPMKPTRIITNNDGVKDVYEIPVIKVAPESSRAVKIKKTKTNSLQED